MSLPRLKRRLELQTEVRGADGVGGFVSGWEKLGTLWAEIVPGTGRQLRRGEASQSRVPLKITVRIAPQGSAARPRAGQRFVEGARIFTIEAVTERDPSGAYLTCHAEEEIVT